MTLHDRDQVASGDEAGQWLVLPDVDQATALRVLSRDRIANGYALTDLEPPFEEFTTVAVARRGDATEPDSACQTLRDPDFTAMATFGDPDGLAAILAQTDLPESAHIALALDHRDAIERIFTLTNVSERWRMAVDEATFVPSTAAIADLQALGPGDADHLLDLYAAYGESFFLPAQLAHGVFYGVRENGRLLAAAGTHTVGRRAGIAAVGNVYTREEARGRGYAAAATAAVVRDLLTRGCRDVVLNVAITNDTAIRVYERLGFCRHSRYLEASARRRA